MIVAVLIHALDTSCARGGWGTILLVEVREMENLFDVAFYQRGCFLSLAQGLELLWVLKASMGLWSPDFTPDLQHPASLPAMTPLRTAWLPISPATHIPHHPPTLLHPPAPRLPSSPGYAWGETRRDALMHRTCQSALNYRASYQLHKFSNSLSNTSFRTSYRKNKLRL